MGQPEVLAPRAPWSRSFLGSGCSRGADSVCFCCVIYGVGMISCAASVSGMIRRLNAMGSVEH